MSEGNLDAGLLLIEGIIESHARLGHRGKLDSTGIDLTADVQDATAMSLELQDGPEDVA
jgi:hypothetical protein